MSNVVHLRPPSNVPKTEADPLGTLGIAQEILDGTVSGKYKSIIAMVEDENGEFEVIQTGCASTLKLIGALQFAQLEIYLEAKAEASEFV